MNANDRHGDPGLSRRDLLKAASAIALIPTARESLAKPEVVVAAKPNLDFKTCLSVTLDGPFPDSAESLKAIFDATQTFNREPWRGWPAESLYLEFSHGSVESGCTIQIHRGRERFLQAITPDPFRVHWADLIGRCADNLGIPRDEVLGDYKTHDVEKAPLYGVSDFSPLLDSFVQRPNPDDLFEYAPGRFYSAHPEGSERDAMLRSHGEFLASDDKPNVPQHGLANDFVRSRQEQLAMRPMFEELYREILAELAPGVEFEINWDDET